MTDIHHLIEELLDLFRESEVGADLTAAAGELLAKVVGADGWHLRRPGSPAEAAAGDVPPPELTDADIETLLAASETRFLPAESEEGPSFLVVPVPAAEGAAGACILFWNRPPPADPLDLRSSRTLVMTL